VIFYFMFITGCSDFPQVPSKKQHYFCCRFWRVI